MVEKGSYEIHYFIFIEKLGAQEVDLKFTSNPNTRHSSVILREEMGKKKGSTFLVRKCQP